MSEENKDLSDFLSSTIESIGKSTDSNNIALIGPIEIEVAVVTKKQAGGKFKIIVVEAGADYKNERISKIKLSIGSKEGMYKNFAWQIPRR